MANDSAYNILSEFSDDSLKNIQPIQGGFVEYAPAGEPEKDPVNVDIATKDVQNTDYFDLMSDYYAGTYLPVKQEGELEFQRQYNALGLGKKYTPEQFKSTIENYIGEIPKSSTTDKAFRFLFDSLNAKTPFYGAAGVFDVIAQATGKYLDREENQKAMELQRNLQIGELAVKQAQEANQNLFLKEADLREKMMGYNFDLQKSYLGMDEEIRKKLLAFDLDVDLNKVKTSSEMLKNLQKPISMVYTKDGKNYIPTAVQLRPNEDMTGVIPYSLQQVEQPDGTFKMEFREGPPEGTTNYYFTTSVSDPSESAIGATKLAGPSATQFAEAQSEYYGLKNAGNLIEDIIIENNQSIAAGTGPTVGVRGLFGKLKQGIRLTGSEILDEIQGNNGVSLGDALYEFGSAKAGDMKKLSMLEKQGQDVYVDTDFDAANMFPITLEKFDKPNGTGGTEEITFQTGALTLNNLLDPNWYQVNLNYNPAYAKNAVREKIIAYALARGLKSTGRLNVDDLQQARDATQLYGFIPSAEVITKLNVILDTIRNAQINTISALKFGSNLDLTQIDPDIKKDYDQLQTFLEKTGRDNQSLYNRIDVQPPVEEKQGGDSSNNTLIIDDDEPAQSLDINSWTGGN